MLENVWMLGLMLWAGPVVAMNVTKTVEGNFVVPKDTVLFLNAQTSCNPPPRSMKAAFALRCGGIQATRECMGVQPMAPIFFGRNCRGNKCTMYLNPEETDCALSASRVHRTDGNETRCGLQEEDSYLLTPTDFTPGVHSASSGECIYGLPAGINVFLWFPCENGTLRHVMELVFEEEPASEFSCQANPTCETTSYLSHIICYSDGANLMQNGAILDRTSSMSFSLMLIILAVWMYQL